MDNSKLRAQARKKRKTLSALQQTLAAKRISKRVCALNIYKRAQHIAFYAAFDGEINPRLIQQHALKHNKHCYLPTIIPSKKQLRFHKVTQNSILKAGHFNIFESTKGKKISVRKLDLVIMPLTAFDINGNRLGMGGGYYDYSFQALNQTKFPKTYLLGIAHNCQLVNKIETQDWDIKPRKIVSV